MTQVPNPARFVVLPVAADITIADLASSKSINIPQGAGYYSLERQENVSVKKSIIGIHDVDGTILVDTAARTKLSISTTAALKLKPADIAAGWTVYIQSTSMNRVLRAGWKLLYLDYTQAATVSENSLASNGDGDVAMADGDDDDQEEDAKPAPKAKAPASRKRKKKEVVVEEEDEEEEEEEEENAKKQKTSGPLLAGMTFCLSGTLSEGRAAVSKTINLHGGSVASTVTASVTHLITTASECCVGVETKKVVAAQKKGIHVVGESFLRALLKGEKAKENAHSLVGGGADDDDDDVEEEEEEEEEEAPVAKKKKLSVTKAKSIAKASVAVKKERKTTTTTSSSSSSATKGKAVVFKPPPKDKDVDQFDMHVRKPLSASLDAKAYCCVACNYRRVFTAVKAGDKAALKKLLDARDDIPAFTEAWSAHCRIEPVAVALQHNDLELFKLVWAGALNLDYEEKKAAKKGEAIEGALTRVSYPNMSQAFKIDTGESSSSSGYNQRTQSLQGARGAKEGNTAFILGGNEGYYGNYKDKKCLMAIARTPDCPKTLVDWALSRVDQNMYGLGDALLEALKYGNLKAAAAMAVRAATSSECGINKIHVQVLNSPGKALEGLTKMTAKKKSAQESVTPIHFATLVPNTAHLEKLIQSQGVAGEKIHDAKQRTPTHFAAAAESSNALTFLLAKGGDPTAPDKDGLFPLHWAARAGRAKNIKLILDHIDKANGGTGKGKAKAKPAPKPKGKLTAAAAAAAAAAGDPVAMALNACPPRGGYASLGYAAEGGHLEVVDAILKRGANIDAQFPGPKLTAIHLASRMGHIKVVEHLLDAGAKIDAKDKVARTPLHYAIINGHYNIVHLLLERGASVTVGDTSNNAAVHYAAGYGWLDILQLLLKQGADANALTMWNLTPLFVAMLKGHSAIVTFLLSLPTLRLDTKDDQGHGLLHIALGREMSRESLAMALLLLKHPAVDVNVTDSQQLTPLHILSRGPKVAALQMADVTESLSVVAGASGSDPSPLTPKQVQALWNQPVVVDENEYHRKNRINQLIARKQAKPEYITLCRLAGSVLQAMVDRGVDLNATTATGDTAVHIAARACPSLCWRMLQSPACDPNVYNLENDTPFTVAVKKQCFALANEFLANDRVELPARPDSSGRSFLHTVIGGVNTLLTYKWKNDQGAEDNKNNALLKDIKKLLAALSKRDKTELEGPASTQDDLGFTPLLMLLEYLQTNVVATTAAPVAEEVNSDYDSDDDSDSDSDGPSFGVKIKKLAPSLARSESDVKTLADNGGFNSPEQKKLFSDVFDVLTGFGSLEVAIQAPPAEADDADRELVEKNADTNSMNWQERNAANAAAQQAKTRIAKRKDIRDNKAGLTPLHFAVLGTGTLFQDLTMLIIDRGASVDVRTTTGLTPLHMIAGQKNPPVAVLKKLIQTAKTGGIDLVNLPANDGRTALHIAVKECASSSDTGLSDMCHLLIKSGADFTAADHKGRTVLHHAFPQFEDKNGKAAVAALRDPIEVISDLMALEDASGNQTTNPNARTKHGRTPLHYAARSAATVSTVFLLNRGAELDAVDKDGATPLLTALKNMRFDYAVLLMTKGARVSGTFGGRSLFSFVITKPAGRSLAYLMVDLGVALDSAIGETLKHGEFHTALRMLSKVDTRRLCAADPVSQKRNLMHTLGSFKTHDASLRKRFETFTREVFKVLHTRGVSITLIDEPGNLPIHLAALNGNTTLVKLILAEVPDPKAHINTNNNEGDTPLGLAVVSGHSTIVDMLLKAGANADVLTKGKTLLMQAVIANDEHIAQSLIKAGAPVNATDGQGWSAMHYVVAPVEFGSFENVKLMKLLHDAKADHTLKNKEGKTPADLAVKQQRGALSKLLQSYAGGKKAKATSSMDVDEEGYPDPVNVDKDARTALDKARAAVEAAGQHMPSIDPLSKFQDVGKLAVDLNGKAYDCTLTYTNVGEGYYGVHSFYRMQLIHHTARNVFVLWTRWGRVGENGQYQRTPFNSELLGVKEFKKVFRQKTRQDWDKRENFKQQPGKYRLLELMYGERAVNRLMMPVAKDGSAGKNGDDTLKDIRAKFSGASNDSDVPACTLHPTLRHVFESIADSSLLFRALNKLGLDEDDFPLGHLCRGDLEKGLEVLNVIGKTVKAWDAKHGKTASVHADPAALTAYREEVNKLTNQYLDLVPRALGGYQCPKFSKADTLYKEFERMSQLVNLEIASKVLLAAQCFASQQHPLDYVHRAVGCQMDVVDKESAEFLAIRRYVRNTRQSTIMRVASVIRVKRKGEDERFAPHQDLHRLLLWHGSQTANFLGILSEGLRIAPKEAPNCGAMFGKGIYLADMACKSSGYCSQSGKKKPAFMLLCDAAIGTPARLTEADMNIEQAKPKTQSTQGVGRVAPPPDELLYTPSGAAIPYGRAVAVPKSKSKPATSLNYNEFILYKEGQVRIRYLVELEWLRDEEVIEKV